MTKRKGSSKCVAASAIQMALVDDRLGERELISQYREQGIYCAATDFGGNYLASISDMIERTVVAARREQVIASTHREEGAVAGAAHEAVMQVINKASGLNVGGKIGVARLDDHICVCVFFAVGLLHLDEVAIGLGHRVV